MDKLDKVIALNEMLLAEQPQYRAEAARLPESFPEQRRLMRSLMNLRPPGALSPELLRLQDEILTEEREAKGVVAIDALPAARADARLLLWQGDITRLAADAIVNAANSRLLGCFLPCHGCIDNAIHSAAGLQLREECAALMREQGREEATGRAKLTRAYNLPARYVIHTVGPIVQGALTAEHERLLASCYTSCLKLAAENGLCSIAFCCISTGEFHFPNRRAAEIALATVRNWLNETDRTMKVIFNVFKDEDLAIYSALLM